MVDEAAGDKAAKNAERKARKAKEKVRGPGCHRVTTERVAAQAAKAAKFEAKQARLLDQAALP